MAVGRSDLLAAVEVSPRAAAAHDRGAWVELFTADGRVEDPVGSRPHVGRTQIGGFYDTFIGPREIVFHPDFDVVCGQSVVRDLDLEVTMGSAVTMTIPAFLRYDLRGVDGEWKIEMLRAYWELPEMMLRFLRNGFAALPAALQLAQGLFRNQGPGGAVGFGAGFRRPGRRHKQLADAFLGAIARADRMTTRHTLTASATVTLGDDDPIDAVELIERLDGLTWTKMIGAGSTIAVSTSSDHGQGVLFADLAARGNAIGRVRYFSP